jgi:hypothetical protein
MNYQLNIQIKVTKTYSKTKSLSGPVISGCCRPPAQSIVAVASVNRIRRPCQLFISPEITAAYCPIFGWMGLFSCLRLTGWMVERDMAETLEEKGVTDFIHPLQIHTVSLFFIQGI